MMGSGDVYYEGSKAKEDCIRGDCLRWLGKRRLSLLSLSCERHIGNLCDGPVDVTSKMVLAAARNSRKLKALRLRLWYDGFTAAHMADIAVSCQDVETLDCLGSFILDVETLDFLGSFILNVETLDFLGSFILKDCTDAVLIAAVSGKHKLKNVNFSSCSAMTNASLVALSSHCPHIIKPDFFNCYKITDEGLVSFIQGCPLIEDLNLRNKICFKSKN